MRYHPLGNSGLLVSVVGLGCNNFGGRLDLAGTKAVIDTAIEEGITLLDTADVYGGTRSEELMGEALQGKRDQVVLATKWGLHSADLGYGPAAGAKGGRHYIKVAVEGSLRRLRTDYLDLYQFHRPDPVTPIEETLAALTELVNEGKVRYIGSSNFAGWEIARASHVAKENGFVPFISAQNHYSLLERGIEADVIPAAAAYGQGLLPYFPLANGLLTGKVRRDTGAPDGTRLAENAGYLTDDKFDRVEALEKWGAEHGRSLLDIAIAGLAAQPTVSSVIAGATRPEQVRANAAAADWQPTADELADLDRLAPTLRPS